jgi:drug/metabolite transporter (DMT)-like permease
LTRQTQAHPSPTESGSDGSGTDGSGSHGSGTDDAAFGRLEGSLFVAISIIWGSSFLLIDLGLEGLTPATVTLGRVGLGALTLLALRFVGRKNAKSIRPEDRLRVVLLAAVWVAIPFSLFPLAQQSINSALTGLLNGATPIWVTVLSIVLTGRRPNRTLLTGLVLGFVGVVLISLPSLGEGSSEAKGVLLVLAATVCYGLAINLAAPLQQRYGAVTLMAPLLTVASIPLVPVALLDWDANRFSASTVVPVVALGVIGTGVAYWIMSTLVGRAGAVRASFITYLIPVVSLILGIVFRGDRVAALAIAGACLTTVGALLASGRITVRSPNGKGQ